MTFNPGIDVPDELSRLSLGQDTPPRIRDAPELNNTGTIPVDITEKFKKASSALQPGEIVKDEFFTLFESVGALEIMDPKMDSGCVKPGDEFEELYDVSKPLLPEEVLGIIDQLLCHETVFTSVYVESLMMPDPTHIEEAVFVRRGDTQADAQPMLQVLRAYCLGMLKACAYVNERVKSEHYYEEEDFVTNTYNRTLLGSLSTADIRAELNDAANVVQKQREHLGGEISEALSSRLKLRDIFLSAAECPQFVAQPDLARQPWETALMLLPTIKATHGLSKQVDESFSVKLQRKLASTVPPRPIVKLSFENAFGHLDRLFKDGCELINVLSYTNSQCLQTFLRHFQAKKPQPLVYVRTLLQTFLFDAMEMLGGMSIRMIMDDDLAIVSLPASPYLDRANDDIEVLHDPRFIISQQMEAFRKRAAEPFLDIFRTFCQNRCRVRRTLCHNIERWDQLQADAEQLDLELQARAQEVNLAGQKFSPNTIPVEDDAWSLSMWTYLYKLRQMEWIVQLGFELEVYQPDELAGMYWYLSYLSKTRIEYVPRLRKTLTERVKDLRESPAQNRRNPAVERQMLRTLEWIRLSLLDAVVTWGLSEALASLYTACSRLELLTPPPRPYSNDELRYELRMKPFAKIETPGPISFEQFAAHTSQQGVSTEELLLEASKAMTDAKKACESMSKMTPEESFSVGSHDRWLASIKNTLKSCIATGLAIATVQKAMREDTRGGKLKLTVEVPTPDKTYHEWWIVPKIAPEST
ncbi:N-alpha-acetyltransferase 35 [Emericellopsis cladophorae]|uniref:N-alpha-acetyltransferase 35 n=1 Tax=Emericellopsis cladophorae TaxID=2686198 RepID=A0A9Q0BEG9_9HYPO|nr:N-alpha-acetyltransferase 35 [Emericellopsis cladophorae]KAI6781851.1 N-alpha-acetyltransferase 35 [Emericellopsis cladophorae]